MHFDAVLLLLTISSKEMQKANKDLQRFMIVRLIGKKKHQTSKCQPLGDRRQNSSLEIIVFPLMIFSNKQKC